MFRLNSLCIIIVCLLGRGLGLNRTVSTISFILPYDFLSTNSSQVLTPTCDELAIIERKVIEKYHSLHRRKTRQSDREGRRYVVYDRPKEEKKKKKQKCGGGGVSAFTFLNFVMGSVSIAANLMNNVNSNNDNNNNNNNDNNNNVANVNIGNNNNAGNNANTVMFMPMNGRRSLMRRFPRFVKDNGDSEQCPVSSSSSDITDIALDITQLGVILEEKTSNKNVSGTVCAIWSKWGSSDPWKKVLTGRLLAGSLDIYGHHLNCEDSLHHCLDNYCK